MNKNSEQIRRQHNLDLIRRMRGGDPLTSFDSKASWFPPRPIIEKDEKEMSRLYKGEAKQAPRIVTVQEKRMEMTSERGNVKAFPVQRVTLATPGGLDEAS